MKPCQEIEKKYDKLRNQPLDDIKSKKLKDLAEDLQLMHRLCKQVDYDMCPLEQCRNLLKVHEDD